MSAPALLLTVPFFGTPAYFSGTGSTTLVPSTFPVAINGRPYMVDQKSGKFARGYEQRVRDSQDISTAPGEAAINPGGLWRRGQDSWHYGAGQRYADTAEAQDFRFYKSKGVSPWVKGQLSLLNATTNVSGNQMTGTNLPMIEVNGYIYVGDGQTLKYIQTTGANNVFSSSPSWTTVTGTPSATINDITTDGVQVYVAFASNSIYMTTPGGVSAAKHFLSSTNVNFTRLGFAKGFVMSYHPDTPTSHIHIVPYLASNTKATTAELRDPNFVCAGFAGGQNHIYVAGRSNDAGVVYRLGITAAGLVDVAIVALELPIGEYPTAIHAYLGSILLGTNKGVRFCSPDSNGNLVAGALIPTSSAVLDFTSEGKFVWFTWTNYDGVSSGLGRMDLSTFIGTNTTAFSTDLMFTSTDAVRSCVSFDNKRIFTISGLGVVVEDTSSLVASASIESGTFRWGIPDRKFVAKVDARSEPLKGSVEAFLSNDESEFDSLGTWNSAGQTEYTFEGTDTRAIEAAFKFVLTRGATVTEGPVVTRWMARAYAAPFRSQVFSIPVLLHHKLSVKGKDYYLNVQDENDALDNLIANPQIVLLQIGSSTHSVIVEDIEWTPVDSYGNTWEWEGTATVTMRSVEN